MKKIGIWGQSVQKQVGFYNFLNELTVKFQLKNEKCTALPNSVSREAGEGGQLSLPACHRPALYQYV